MNLGKTAPDFKLKDKSGKPVSLNGLKSDFTVLYFYPKDDTPGCTIEAQEFNSSLKSFQKLGAEIIGISGGDEKSKAKFCSKYKLNLTLLSDPDFKVSKAFKAYGPKTFMGKKFNGIFRKTFILDKGKKVIKVFEKVEPKIHADEVAEFIASQKSGKPTGLAVTKKAAATKKVSVGKPQIKKSPVKKSVKKSTPTRAVSKKGSAKKASVKKPVKRTAAKRR